MALPESGILDVALFTILCYRLNHIPLSRLRRTSRSQVQPFTHIASTLVHQARLQTILNVVHELRPHPNCHTSGEGLSEQPRAILMSTIQAPSSGRPRKQVTYVLAPVAALYD